MESITERLSLYTTLDGLEKDEDLQAFHEMLTDRFGPVPPPVESLFTTIRCRRMAKELGFEKMIVKGGQMRLYFISNPDSPYFEGETFHHIMQYIQTRVAHAKMKQSGKLFYLIVDNVGSMEAAEWFLKGVVGL